MVALIYFGLLLFLLIINIPIGFALGITSLGYFLFFGNLNLIILPQKIYNGIDSFPLLAIPFFLLAAEIMSQAGLTRRIINIFNAFFGWIRGGLAITNVGASMFFTGISGSAVADSTSIGAVLIPAMKEEGYDADFSAAITASSSVCGPIIPPSIPFIIYGVIAKVSIFALFLGGALPGFVLGISLCIAAYVISRIRKYPKHEVMPLKAICKTVKEGFWALLMPVILIGGIVGGVFTVTELAAVTVIYAFGVGFFIYREVKLNHLMNMIVRVVIDSSVVMIIVGLSNLFAFSLTIEHIPEAVTALMNSVTTNRIALLVLVNIIILLAGMFLDSTPATIILVPILLPVAGALDISPVQFGVILVFNLMMGLLTPPVCLTLIISSKIAKCSLFDSLKESAVYFCIMVLVLLLVTYYAPFSEFIPKLVLS